MYVMNRITNICLNDLSLLFWWNKRVQIMSSSKIRFKKQYGPTVLLDACGVSIMHSSTQSRSGANYGVLPTRKALNPRVNYQQTSYPKSSNLPGKVLCFSSKYLTSHCVLSTQIHHHLQQFPRFFICNIPNLDRWGDIWGKELRWNAIANMSQSQSGQLLSFQKTGSNGGGLPQMDGVNVKHLLNNVQSITKR